MYTVALAWQVYDLSGAPTALSFVAVAWTIPQLIFLLVGDMLYAAGQLASHRLTGIAAEARQDPAFPYYGSDIQKQTRYILQNLRTVFDAAGCGLEDVVKWQVFLTDLDDFYYFDQVWKQFFPSPPPRTTLQVSDLLVPGCRVEIDLTACRR